MDAPLQSSVKTEIPSPSSSDKHPCRSDSSTRSAYMCRKCRVHGLNEPVKRHKRVCPFKECSCNACQLVNNGRSIVAKQIALYRDQKVTNGSGQSATVTSQTGPGPAAATPTNSAVDFTLYRPMVDVTPISNLEGGPHCRKCRNHGLINAWKGHKKKCLFQTCNCPLCRLITERKINEKSLREIEAHSLQGHIPVDIAKTHITESHMSKVMTASGYGLNPLPMPAPQPPNYSYNASITAARPNSWAPNGMYSSAPGCWDSKLSPQPGGNPYNHSYNSMVITPNHFPATTMLPDHCWSSFYQ